MEQGPIILIRTREDDAPHIYVIPEITKEDLAYLHRLEGVHCSNLDDHAIAEAFFYVSCAIGKLPASLLELTATYLEDDALSLISAASLKWQDCRVKSFAEVNEQYGGHIVEVFCINHCDV